MKIEDFSYMNKGSVIGNLSQNEIHLLNPIELIRAPSGKALLLLHGFSSSPAVFRELMPAFSAYDAVYCPVLPGHAESIERFATVTAEEWLSASENLTAEIIKKYSKLDVMGLSLGGLLGCHLATKFNLNHLYLLAPALYLQFNIPVMARAVQVLHTLGVRTLRNRAGNIQDSSLGELAYRQLPLKTIIAILNFIREYTAQIPSCPIDIFLGRHDKVVNSKKIAKLFRDISHANIHWLENSAHVLPLDADRELIANIFKTL